MVLLLLCPVGVEYAGWKVILVSFVLLLTSTAEESVTMITEDEYLEYELVQLPDPNSLDEIAPSVRVFSNYVSPSDEIINNVTKSVEAINSHLTITTSRIVFITHGFTGSINDPWMDEMKNATLGITSGNQQVVVIVGWKKGAKFWQWPLYWQAAANTQPVGTFIGDIVTQVKGRRPNLQIYGIGHSLGSHVMGKEGRHSSLFSRITGLDPAGPSFEANNVDKRLSATDAGLVDAIHSDGNWQSGLWVLRYGTLIPLGHLDFYPNWGKRSQPGCYDIAGVADIAGCSHSKAIEYFIWSISNKYEFLCESRIINAPTWDNIDTEVDIITEEYGMPQIGYYADTRLNKRGYYHIATNADPPFVPVSNALKVQWCPPMTLFLLTIYRF